MNRSLFALIISTLIYAAWYRISVGPWCVAMWFGTAPIVIVGASFLIIYRKVKIKNILK